MTVALGPTPVLSTERLTLRAPVAADWPAWRAFAASERSRFLLDDDRSARTAWRAFGHAIGHWVLRGFGSFVFHRHDNPTPLGMAGPWFPEGWPETEIGWSVWPAEAEGRGYAHEAAQATLRFARDALRWPAAVSYIDAGNVRSIALARRLGATPDPAAAAPFEGSLVYRHWGSA